MAEYELAEYVRTLSVVNAHCAIFEAEDIVTRAWLAELDVARREALDLVKALRVAEAVSTNDLQAALRRNDPVELAEAQQEMEESRRELDDGMVAAQALLSRVDEQIERACQAAADRGSRYRDDMDRLRLAWHSAFGADVQPDCQYPESLGESVD